MTQDDGGYAFPLLAEKVAVRNLGMTLRDYFAAQALAVIPGDVADPADLARDAYRIADAMLDERQRLARTTTPDFVSHVPATAGERSLDEAIEAFTKKP